MTEISNSTDLYAHYIETASQWQKYLAIDYFIQAGWVVLTLLLAVFFTRRIRHLFENDVTSARRNRKWYFRPLVAIRRALYPSLCILSFFAYALVAEYFDHKNGLVEIGISLATAWLLISFVTSFIHSRKLYRWTTTFLWIVASLNILNVWNDALTFLDGFTYSFGNITISLLSIMKGLVWVAVLMYAASALSRFGERQIRTLEEISPSAKELMAKFLKFFLFSVAVLFGLNAIGLNLTTLTIFSGAAGLGLGFGLQKVFSNYISGIILLLDRSIKPGDVIALEAIGSEGDKGYGWVKSLTARYVSIITRDGKEHLIPNEMLITDKVENWSHTDQNIRIHIPVGISYNSDVHLALQLVSEAVNEEPRIITPPSPIVLVIGFGNSSVDLEARCWMKDPVNGITNVKSAILVRIWDKFHEHGIEIPFPQRDLHLKTVDQDVVKKLAKALQKPEKKTPVKKKS
jgi:small-conductance mechanosensitive channel